MPTSHIGETPIRLAPLDLPAIAAWTARNEFTRHAYAVRLWQIDDNERKRAYKARRKAAGR